MRYIVINFDTVISRHLPVLFQNDFAELRNILNTDTGMVAYMARFWQGFYPLLFVELQTDDGYTPRTDAEHKTRDGGRRRNGEETPRRNQFLKRGRLAS